MEVAIMDTLTSNIHTLLVPFYRPTTRRYKILIEGGAFPSDRYVASSAAHSRDLPANAVVELFPREGEHALRTEDIVAKIKELGDTLAVVLFAGVQYQTGQYFDVEAITRVTHEVGAYAGFDLAHAVGNVRLDLHEKNVDFACWCSYKYLNSGPGGIAGLYIHERHGKNTSLPRTAGWWGHQLSTRFKMTDPFMPIEGAYGFRHSNPCVLATVALQASLELFDRAGIDALVRKQRLLTAFLEGLLKATFPNNLTILTPTNVKERGCQLSLVFSGSKSARELEHLLALKGVIVDVRGHIVRVAPTPLYNTFADAVMLVEALKAVL